jgi:hypothetical protein
VHLFTMTFSSPRMDFRQRVTEHGKERMQKKNVIPRITLVYYCQSEVKYLIRQGYSSMGFYFYVNVILVFPIAVPFLFHACVLLTKVYMPALLVI